MILGYKKLFPWGEPTNFKTKILSGKKKHSLRQDKNNRWHAGMKIQHAHGVRTKQYDHFANGECKSTQIIRIIIHDNPKYGSVYIDGKTLSPFEIQQLSYNDGFDSVSDFFRWFFDGFEGKIIHFTDLRY